MGDIFRRVQPSFTARRIAMNIGNALGRKPNFKEADERENVDGSVEVTKRVHVQVGTDYLVVCAWKDEITLRTWSTRKTIRGMLTDLIAAVKTYPGPPL